MSLIITATGPAVSSSIDYDAVRAAIDTSLTDADLPNATIDRSPFAPSAWAEVLQRDSSAASRTGDAAERGGRAWVYLTAARLCPVLPQITQENSGDNDYSYRREKWDAVARARELRGMADVEFAAYLEASGRPTPPTFFAVARASRGCCR